MMQTRIGPPSSSPAAHTRATQTKDTRHESFRQHRRLDKLSDVPSRDTAHTTDTASPDALLTTWLHHAGSGSIQPGDAASQRLRPFGDPLPRGQKPRAYARNNAANKLGTIRHAASSKRKLKNPPRTPGLQNPKPL